MVVKKKDLRAGRILWVFKRTDAALAGDGVSGVEKNRKTGMGTEVNG